MHGNQQETTRFQFFEVLLMITELFPFYNESAVVLVLPVSFKQTEIVYIELRKKKTWLR